MANSRLHWAAACIIDLMTTRPLVRAEARVFLPYWSLPAVGVGVVGCWRDFHRATRSREHAQYWMRCLVISRCVCGFAGAVAWGIRAGGFRCWVHFVARPGVTLGLRPLHWNARGLWVQPCGWRAGLSGRRCFKRRPEFLQSQALRLQPTGIRDGCQFRSCSIACRLLACPMQSTGPP